MARLRAHLPPTGQLVLVVDDDPDLRSTLVHLLRGHGHEVDEASSGEMALRMCRARSYHLMLLDYFMPGLTGKDVVEQVRTFDPQVQIVLQTGYASEKPPRQMLAELNIQGYHDKSEGPERLLVWVDAALKTYRHVRALHASRQGLESVLRATSELHRLQTVDDLLRCILVQLQGLLGFGGAGFVLLVTQAAFTPVGMLESAVCTGTGRFESARWTSLEASDQQRLLRAFELGEAQFGPLSVLPLTVGRSRVGMILFDQPAHGPIDSHVLKLFASQASVAVENARLYALATVDALTGLLLKRPWRARLAETLALASRAGVPTSVLMLDLDHFKQVNDTYGHLAGDRVLTRVGALVREVVRRSDVPGRYGGEELVVILPNTDAHGAQVLALRLLEAVSALRVPWAELVMQGTVSIGVATTPAAQAGQPGADEDLLARADAALYQAKRFGRNRFEMAGFPDLEVTG